MFLRGLFATINLIVWAGGIDLLLTLDHFAHWYLIILLADKWEMPLFEILCIELVI